MYSIFFFIVGLANLVMAVLLFIDGEVMLGIGITLIGLSCTINNGINMLQSMKGKEDVG